MAHFLSEGNLKNMMEDKQTEFEFNQRFNVADILSVAGFTLNNQRNLYEYHGHNSSLRNIDIRLDNDAGCTVIEYCDNDPFLHKFHTAYQCYDRLICFYRNYPDNDPTKWKTDPQLFPPQSQPSQPPAPLYVTPPHSLTPAVTQPIYNYAPLPQPAFDIDRFLNSDTDVSFLNLDCLIPPTHVIHKMATYLSKEFPLPISTLILVGLGVVSGMTTRKWNCAYQKRGTKPICLYVVAEQKSGKGKTAALTIFQEPLRNAVSNHIKKIESVILTKEENLTDHLATEADDLSKEYKAKFKLKSKQLKTDLDLWRDKLKKTYALLPKTLVTSEALEESLNNTNGFFLVAADEQTLIDSLISSKGKKSNGVLLCGRNGEDFYSELRTRKGYNGKITGSFICFSQYGCIEKIMNASGGTGLCERFLMISEPEFPEMFSYEKLPNIDDPQPLFDEYASKFNFLKDIIEKPLKHDELITLKISDNGWLWIKLFEDELKRRKLSGELSHDMLSVMASKADTQIMSIASNLYLLDLDSTMQPSSNGDNYIPDHYVDIAIKVFRELILGVRNYCEANGIIGNKEQIAAIMNCFFDKSKSHYVHLNLEQIKHKCEQLNIFKNLKNKRKIIVDLLYWLCNQNIILNQNGMYQVNKYQPTIPSHRRQKYY